MNRKTVDEDWRAFLGGQMAESLEQDQDAGRLLIVQARIVANHDVVEKNIDVGTSCEWKGVMYEFEYGSMSPFLTIYCRMRPTRKILVLFRSKSSELT